jgi:hypothetical protein
MRIVSLISWNSYCTVGWCRSPFAWYLPRMLRASSLRPLAMSQRGDLKSRVQSQLTLSHAVSHYAMLMSCDHIALCNRELLTQE